ncbi:major facilitator superfamily transporter [Apiospora hydei]|uniref:Major facilitator superfamily transporter n=1 Tax=Apiospora hydei TaxID=1337664 RepID=A0ABR1WWQ5_9PEZI
MASPTASESKIEAQRDGPDVANSAVLPAYGDAPYSAVDEKKLVAKLDRRIVPLVMLSYTLSFLDSCFMVAMGLYIVFSPCRDSSTNEELRSCPTTAPRYGKRTTACGMNLTIGNMSGIMAPFIYLTGEGPRYIRGNAVSLSMVGMAVGLYGFLWFWFRRENKRRDAGQVSAEHAHLSEEELMELGDESPHYRYTY